MAKKNVFKRIEWTVKLTKESIEHYEPEEHIASDSFSVYFDGKETKWCLKLYPNGNTLDEKSHLSLFLSLKDSNDLHFDVKFELGIKSQTGDHFMAEEDFTTIVKMKAGYGNSQIMDHKELFNPTKQYFVDNKFTIICELKLIKSSKDKPVTPYSEYKKAFENELFADFELKTSDGKTLKAHKVILVARSPMFYTMLTNDMTEAKDGYAKVPDFDSKIMKEVLRFIYYNEVESLDEIAFDLSYVAEKYQLDGLKEICLDSIIASLSIDNITNALMVADRLSNSENLFDKCMDFIISKNLSRPEVWQWGDLSKAFLMKVIENLLSRSRNIIHL